MQPCTESPWWISIAGSIGLVLCGAITAMWVYLVRMQREHKKDLHRALGWPVSGAPPAIQTQPIRKQRRFNTGAHPAKKEDDNAV